MSEKKRILVAFSCGAASAVVWKVAFMRYGKTHNVVAYYCASVQSDEHPDNIRFRQDIESWVGAKCEEWKHPKYSSIDQVFEKERFMVGPFGAICTRRLKREIREANSLPEDLHVLGLTSDEGKRIDQFKERHPDVHCLWLLATAGITKDDCYGIIQSAGIQLPWMYRNGYDHNNCIGCVKGGMGYWNKIRKDFPDVFAKRAAQQREIGCQFGGGENRFWLDELDPEAGRDVKEPNIECGIFCGEFTNLVISASKA